MHTWVTLREQDTLLLVCLCFPPSTSVYTAFLDGQLIPKIAGAWSANTERCLLVNGLSESAKQQGAGWLAATADPSWECTAVKPVGAEVPPRASVFVVRTHLLFIFLGINARFLLGVGAGLKLPD